MDHVHVRVACRQRGSVDLMAELQAVRVRADVVLLRTPAPLKLKLVDVRTESVT